MKSKASSNRGSRSIRSISQPEYGNQHRWKNGDLDRWRKPRSARYPPGNRRVGYRRRDACADGPGSVGSVEPPPLRKGLEGIGNPDDGFGGAQRQYAVGFDRPCKAIEYRGLGVLIEIDQDVAAEDHVEGPEMGKILQQIQLPVLDHRADIGIKLPELSGLLEIFDEHLSLEPALDLELAKDTGFGFFKNTLRQVGCKKSRSATPASDELISFRHIAIEYGSCPVEEAAHQMRKTRRLARACNIIGKNGLSQVFERNLVAKEERSVGGHGLDHIRDQRFGSDPDFLDDFGDAGQASPSRQRDQSAFNQILLVRRDLSPDRSFRNLRKLVVERRHERSPE